MLEIFVAVLLVGSLISFVLYGIDKAKAKKKAWRIPEKVLLGFSFLGGALGGSIAMALFRHKTKHPQFAIGIPVMLAVHILVAVFVYIKFFA